MHHRYVVALALFICWIAGGCSSGEKPLATVPVTGEVKRMNGAPLGKVKVIFYPKEGPTFVAETDDGGKFTVNAIPGETRVAVVPASEATADNSPGAAEAAAAKATKVDSRFASPESSGLMVNVQDKQTEKLVLVVE